MAISLPRPAPRRGASWLLPLGVLAVAYGLLGLTLTRALSHQEIMQRCVLVDPARARLWSVGNIEIGLSYLGVFGGMLFYFLRSFRHDRQHVTDLYLALGYVFGSFVLDYACVQLFHPFTALLIGDAVVMTFAALVSRRVWFQRLLGVFVPMVFLSCGVGHFLEGLSYWHLTYPVNVPWTMVTADIGFAVLLNAGRFPAFLRGEDVVEELSASRRKAETLQVEIDARRRADRERDQAEASRHGAEERYRALFDTMSQGVVYQDAEGRITDANIAAQRLLGLTLDQMQGRTSHDPRWRTVREDGATVPEDEHPSMRALRTGRPVAGAIMGLLQPGHGETRWMRVDATPEFQPGSATPYRVYATFEDITEAHIAQESLRESERRLSLALESGRLGAWQLDISDGRRLDLTPTARFHFGLPHDAEPPGADLFRLVHTEDRERVRGENDRAVAACRDYASEYRVAWPDGGLHWISAHTSILCDGRGRTLRLVGVTEDVTERKAHEAERERLLHEALERADRDPLTGLLNHRAFHKRLEEETARAARAGLPLAVAMLDLDNFKFFNEAYGHAVGDDVLHQAADRLRGICRSYDTIARFGGDEFALLLPGIGEATAADLESRLRAGLDGLVFRPEGSHDAIPICFSVGVSLTGLNDETGRREAVQRADDRLRRSKYSAGAVADADIVRRAMQDSVGGFSMLDALITSVDNKDRYTRRHSEDVLQYSLLIARQLALGEAVLQTVAIAALLHDVGKIGVPDAILRKPGRLTDDEFEAIKQHPQMGAIIVQAVPGLEGTLDAVRHHHERWDGEGYPFGLRGEETPLIARLMAVADALTTDRPYRKGMSCNKALSILLDGAGSQWDPTCVTAFLTAMARTRESND